MKHNKTNDTKTNTNTKKTKTKTLGSKLIIGLILIIAIIFGLIIYNMHNNNNNTSDTNNVSSLLNTNNIQIPLNNFLTSLSEDNMIKEPTIIQKINLSVSINQSLPHDKFSIGEHIYIRFLKQPFI
tara:strand:+ start:350 stop:727 length:378 start_codon:yes stop_codon:yes gene_type:complete